MKAEKQDIRDLRKVKADIVKSLIEEFKDDPEYREGYTEEFFNAKIATQIKVLREQREWSQEQLGNASGMRQERISVLEDVSYESWTVSTLRKLASAFHLVVDIEFKEYGEFASEFMAFNEERLRKRKFEDDPVFNGTLSEQILTNGRVAGLVPQDDSRPLTVMSTDFPESGTKGTLAQTPSDDTNFLDLFNVISLGVIDEGPRKSTGYQPFKDAGFAPIAGNLTNTSENLNV